MQVSNLRVEIAGFPINDYRILGADLEFRTLEPSGNLYPDSRSTWRTLTPNDIMLHFRLNTVVWSVVHGQGDRVVVAGRMPARISETGVSQFER